MPGGNKTNYRKFDGLCMIDANQPWKTPWTEDHLSFTFDFLMLYSCPAGGLWLKMLNCSMEILAANPIQSHD